MLIFTALLLLLGISSAFGDSKIECFGLKCPPGTVMCLYEEKSIDKQTAIIGEAKCYDVDSHVLLKNDTRTPNPKGDVVLNRYKFYGPGIYTKERINYKKRSFFKHMNAMQDTYKRQMEDLRRQMHEDFAEKLKGNRMRGW